MVGYRIALFRYLWHHKWCRKFCFSGWLLLLPSLLAAQEAEDVQEEARQQAERQRREIEQTIQYGIDADLVAAIETLRREAPPLPTDPAADPTDQTDPKDQADQLRIAQTPYNEAIYQRIQKGYSTDELVIAALQFFALQQWPGAEDFVAQTLEFGEQSGAYAEPQASLLLACLAYLRSLRLRRSQTAIAALLRHENAQIVAHSARTLGQIGSQDSAAELLLLLQDEDLGDFANFDEAEQELVRLATIAALGELSYAPAADYLLDILQDAQDEQTEYTPEYTNAEWGAAAKALGEIVGASSTEALSLLLAAFRRGDTQRRYQALQAIDAYPFQAEFADVVLQGLQESYWKTREQAAKAAGKLGLQEAVPSLAYKVAKDSVKAVRRAAIAALRQLDGAGSQALRELLLAEDTVRSHKLEVLRTLLQAQDNEAVAALRQLLEQPEWKGLQRSALLRVASSYPWTALDFVYRQMLADKDSQLRREALRAIARGRIGSLRSAVQGVAEGDPLHRVRQAAKNTLAALAAPSL